MISHIKNKRVISILIPCVIFYLLMVKTSVVAAQELFDDFNGEHLDPSVWKNINRKWGEYDSGLSHGGVVAENVFLKDGNLVIRGNGDLYTGAIKGAGQNHRVGGAISTRERFGSGRYEIRAKVFPKLGALSAFWTFQYKNKEVNHEIDIEIPGKDDPAFLI